MTASVMLMETPTHPDLKLVWEGSEPCAQHELALVKKQEPAVGIISRIVMVITNGVSRLV
jgi:hypothetical protein